MPGSCLVCSLTRFLGLFQAEARLAAKRAARAEAREIRMKELERQQKEVMGAECSEVGSFSFRTVTKYWTRGRLREVRLILA